MKHAIYYMRNENHPCSTIVLLQDDETGETARGVAVCNPADQFVKSMGRDLAYKRAIKAMENRKSFGVYREGRKTEINIMPHMMAKCEFLPELNSHEEKLLSEPVTA